MLLHFSCSLLDAIVHLATIPPHDTPYTHYVHHGMDEVRRWNPAALQELPSDSLLALWSAHRPHWLDEEGLAPPY